MTYSAEVLADSPLVYWRLGEPSGTTAADASGNGHTGTYVNGPTLGVPGLLSGDANTAVTFNNAGNTSCNGNDTPVGPTTLAAFTLECLADIQSTAGTGEIWIVTDPVISAPDLIEIWYGSGVINFDFQGTGGYSPSATYTTAGGTFHIAATFDGSDLRLYIDGVLQDSQAFSDAGAVLTVANCCAAGNYPGPGTIGADATLDECAFYTSALSGARIAVHAAAAAGGGAPTVSDVSPLQGTKNGGTAVTLSGSGFAGATAVKFGGVNAASFDVADDTTIACVTPAHATGTVTVTVE